MQSRPGLRDTHHPRDEGTRRIRTDTQRTALWTSLPQSFSSVTIMQTVRRQAQPGDEQRGAGKLNPSSTSRALFATPQGGAGGPRPPARRSLTAPTAPTPSPSLGGEGAIPQQQPQFGADIIPLRVNSWNAESAIKVFSRDSDSSQFGSQRAVTEGQGSQDANLVAVAKPCGFFGEVREGGRRRRLLQSHANTHIRSHKSYCKLHNDFL